MLRPGRSVNQFFVSALLPHLCVKVLPPSASALVFLPTCYWKDRSLFEGQEFYPFPGPGLCPSSEPVVSLMEKRQFCTHAAVSAACATNSVGYLLPVFSDSFLSLMSVMHPSGGWAFWSDSLDLGTHYLGDLLEFGIIVKLCFGDALGLFHPSRMDLMVVFCCLLGYFFWGAMTVLWKPETADFHRAQNVPPPLW